MDFSFIIGLVACLGLVVFGILNGGKFESFLNIPSVAITVGGTVFSVFMCVKTSTFLQIPKHFGVILRKDKFKLEDYIDVIVDLAQEARVKGLLALEEKVETIDIDDEFLKFCVMLIIDALEATKVREQIENEISCIEARHSAVWKLYERGETLAPAFGMLGTLIGLINMLADMDPDDPSKVTSGMATALITTFYGSFLANVLFAPMGSKLKQRHEEEVVTKELIMEGVLSIQAGENPKYIRDKLKSYLTTKERDAAGDEGSYSADE